MLTCIFIEKAGWRGWIGGMCVGYLTGVLNGWLSGEAKGYPGFY